MLNCISAGQVTSRYVANALAGSRTYEQNAKEWLRAIKKLLKATNFSMKAIKISTRATKLPMKATNSYNSKFTCIEMAMISTY
ncbi:hypothetical protein [Psychrobacillus sp. NPDC096389]|uniref:hypothetical protein n=1 Tax=Psychrobacillus sp. NPDC096389 TaxID=3364490 RepID=UPI0038052E8A